jgi:hypothetical protein
MGTTFAAVIIFLGYLALICLYIYLIILFVRLSRNVDDIKESIKGLAYRDTVRYIDEVKSGSISEAAQQEAEDSLSA